MREEQGAVIFGRSARNLKQLSRDLSESSYQKQESAQSQTVKRGLAAGRGLGRTQGGSDSMDGACRANRRAVRRGFGVGGGP